MASVPRDDNFIPGILVLGSLTGADVVVEGDETTKGMYVYVTGSDVATGGTSAIDDSAFTAGTSSGTPMMGAATADSVDANDLGVVAIDTARNLKVSLEVDNAGIGTTQYDIQDAQGATDTGTVPLVVRNDTLTDLSGGDGNYAPLQVNSVGGLYMVNMDAAGNARGANVDANNRLSVKVDNQADGSLLGKTIQSDNNNTYQWQIIADDTAMPATPHIGVVGGEYRASPTTYADGDATVLQSNVNGYLMIDGTVTADTELPSAVALADNVANPTSPMVGAALMSLDGVNGDWERVRSSLGDGVGAAGMPHNIPMMFNGASVDRLRGDSTNGMLVNLGANNDVTMSTLPDTAAGDLAEITLMNAKLQSGTVIGDVRAAGSGGVLLQQASTTYELTTTVTATANATGQDTLFDADGDNTAQAIKAGAGSLYFLEVSNPNATDAYIQLFDVATGGVTVGTTTPKLSFLVPAGNGTQDGAMDKTFTVPIAFGTAITYACTVEVAGSTDPSVGLIVNAGYK